MADADIVIKYEGGDADFHTVEMRTFGNSLLGFERIISDGLIFFGEGRLPRRGERHTLAVKAREPVIGSTELPLLLTQAAGILPLGWWLLQTGAAEVVSHWMAFVFARYSGRKAEAQSAMEALERVHARELEARGESEERWLDHEAKWRDQLFSLTNNLALAAIRAVAPIGPSVDQVKLNGSKAPPFLIDLPTADAIRAKGELEVTDLMAIELRVDGFVHHNKKLNVENPEKPGSFISADVRDPVFDAVPNIYTEAASQKSVIVVQAKLGYRAGALERIYIMDSGGPLNDAA